MDSLVQAFQQSTPPQWITVVLLFIALLFFRRLLSTFDQMRESIEEIKNTIVGHGETVSDHDKRIGNLEKKVYEL